MIKKLPLIALLSGKGILADTILNLLPKKFNSQIVPIRLNRDETINILDEAPIKIANLIIANLSIVNGDMKKLLDDLKVLRPDIPIILLHHYQEKVFAKEVIKMGANAYIPINFQGDEFPIAIEEVLKNRTFLSANLSD